MRIFLIDQHPLVREAMAALFRRLSPEATVTELERLSTVACAIKNHGMPELICLELVLPDNNGVSGVEELRQQFLEVPIVVLTALPALKYENLAMKAGANAYIQKTLSVTEITNVLRVFLVEESESESKPVAEVEAEAKATAPVQKLSKRQKQLLSFLDKGISNRDIAETLQISEHTVKVHLWRLFRRLDVKSRSQASHWARTQGLLE